MFDTDIVESARSNNNFRTVLFTGEHTQLVVMSLDVSEEIGMETHHKNDQILMFVSGTAKVTVAGATREVTDNDIVVVPAGSQHNVENTGAGKLKLVTIYGPPDHKPGTIHATKADALADEGPAEQ